MRQRKTGQIPPTLFFDTCAFHPPQATEKAVVRKLKELERAGLVHIEFSFATEREAMKAPGKVPGETVGRLYTLEVGLNSQEAATRTRIRALVFANKTRLTPGDENDVTHLFEAQKYGHAFFVTVDRKHILSKAKGLREQFGIRVVSPSECLQALIAERNMSQGLEDIEAGRTIPLKSFAKEHLR